MSATIKSHNTKSFPSKEDLATYGALVMPNVWAIRRIHMNYHELYISDMCQLMSSVVSISSFWWTPKGTGAITESSQQFSKPAALKACAHLERLDLANNSLQEGLFLSCYNTATVVPWITPQKWNMEPFKMIYKVRISLSFWFHGKPAVNLRSFHKRARLMACGSWASCCKTVCHVSKNWIWSTWTWGMQVFNEIWWPNWWTEPSSC